MFSYFFEGDNAIFGSLDYEILRKLVVKEIAHLVIVLHKKYGIALFGEFGEAGTGLVLEDEIVHLRLGHVGFGNLDSLLHEGHDENEGVCLGLSLLHLNASVLQMGERAAEGQADSHAVVIGLVVDLEEGLEYAERVLFGNLATVAGNADGETIVVGVELHPDILVGVFQSVVEHVAENLNDRLAVDDGVDGA